MTTAKKPESRAVQAGPGFRRQGRIGWEEDQLSRSALMPSRSEPIVAITADGS
jgi:hypothetical protein